MSEAWAINERGQVVGSSGLRDLALYPTRAFLWQDGTMTGVGTLAEARDINDASQILATGPVIWQDGRTTELFAHGQGQGPAYAYAINNRGQVVGSGWCLSDDCESGAPKWHAFLWQDDVSTDLGTPGSDVWTDAADINDAGQIVGESRGAGKGAAFIGPSHAFLWQGGRFTDLGTLGGTQSRAEAINDAGQVVGWAEPASGSGIHAFLWQDGVMTDLGTLGGMDSAATDINDLGQVVGHANTASGEIHAFLWQHGVMTDLGAMVTSPESVANSINDRGQIVGWSGADTGDRHAVLWWPRGD